MITTSTTNEVNLMKVYIVTSHDQYDYDTEIVSAFLSEELASAFIDKSILPCLMIEEVEVSE